MELLTVEKLGYQATAYENWGIIDFEGFKKDSILEVLEELNDEEIISLYNDFLSDNYYELYYENNEDFLNEQFKDPAEAVRSALFGDYNYNHDYVTFNGYNNLKSFYTYEVVKKALDDTDFKLWLYDNYNNYDDLGEFIDFMNEHEEEIKNHAMKLVKKGY